MRQQQVVVYEVARQQQVVVDEVARQQQVVVDVAQSSYVCSSQPARMRHESEHWQSLDNEKT